jgi:phosphate/phosphite/phosphonate ABC transporter binding protein
MDWLAMSAVALLLVFSGGCSRQEAKSISLERKTVLKPLSSANRRHPLRIGMGAMITPKEGYVYYHRLKLYLEERLGVPLQLVDRDNYDQVNKLLQSGELDAAFICSGPYVEGHDRFGLELLAVPQVNGRSVYYSNIIVPTDSPAQQLKDLRGKTFAFTDPKSNSGKILPTYMLSLMNESPKRFFGKIIYTYGHDKSIRAVAENFVDGAAVDSLIWDIMVRNDPTLATKARIVGRSIPSGIPPFVVRSDFDPVLKTRLQSLLTSMHVDPRGREILAGMMIEKFVVGNDRDYDSIRMMNAWIAGHRGKD